MKKLLQETEYGEFGTNNFYTLSSTYVDKEEKGENHVYVLTKKDMLKLKEYYEKRKENDNWLLDLYINEKFPGYKKIEEFIDNVVSKIRIFGNKGYLWKKYFKLVFVTSRNNNLIFKLSLAIDGSISEKELPIPKEYFEKLYLGLYKALPKIVYYFKK